MAEIWKELVGFPGKYEISDLGNIRSITRKVRCKGDNYKILNGRVLKQQVNCKGYAIIALSLGTKSPKTFTIHQLVASTFFPDFVTGTELNHKDGNKLNNAVGNLEVSNPSHNQLHAVRTGLTPKQGKSRFNNVTYVKNPKAIKRWAGAIRHNGKSSFGWKTFHTEEEAARHVDFLLDSINDAARNRNFP